MHPLYLGDDNLAIEDNLRIAFSRIRLCSHRLRSETGRWYGVPPDQRLCPHCDGATIQDKQHILQCPSTQDVRDKYGVTSDISILKNPSKTDLICLKQCVKILESSNVQNHENIL